MEKYTLIAEYFGYRNKTDITKIPEVGFIVKGSQNVISTDGERLAIRKGYTLDGAASSDLYPVKSSYEWITSTGTELALRSFNDALQFRYVDSNGDVTWTTLADSFSSVNFNFAEFWDLENFKDALLFVNGTKNIYYWSGGVTTFASATTNTITKQGSTSWAEERFLIDADTKQIDIDGTTYTYTGGESTTTLTGVTPDPTSAGHTAGDLVFQKIRSKIQPVNDASYTASTIAFVSGTPATITDSASNFVNEGFVAGDVVVVSGTTSNDGTYTIASVVAGTITLDDANSLTNESAGSSFTLTAFRDWVNDLIAVLNNQVWLGCFESRNIYVSNQNSYIDYSFSTPRLPNEGILLTIDSTPVGFIVMPLSDSDKDAMYIAGSKNDWYQHIVLDSSDLTNQTFEVKKLKSGPGQGAFSQSSIENIKNKVAFVSNEPTFDELGRIENVDTPQSLPISDPIKNDFDNFNFTNCHVKYFKNNIYIAVPAEGKVLIWNNSRQYWEAPQVLPIRRFAIIGGELYGHSNAVPETYKLFDGRSDNESPIEAIAAFAYRSFGNRYHKKNFTNYFVEGYISSNTNLNVNILYNYEGATQVSEYEINGADDSIIFSPTSDGSLGKNSLGKASLGGVIGEVDESLPPKFRVIFSSIKQDSYEIQEVFSSNDIDQNWEILSFGPATVLSTAKNNEITK